MNELPYRAIIHLETTLGQLRHQPAQREVLPLAPLDEPVAMLAADRLGLVAAHLPRRKAAGPAVARHPVDRYARRHAEPPRRLTARQAVPLHRHHYPLAKIVRIRSSHRCRPPSPVGILNQSSTRMGIPPRFRLISSRSRDKGSCR